MAAETTPCREYEHMVALWSLGRQVVRVPPRASLRKQGRSFEFRNWESACRFDCEGDCRGVSTVSAHSLFGPIRSP